jgi:hypothetical protein
MPSIAVEVLMRILVLTILTIVTVWAAEPVRAQTYDPDYPVCLNIHDLGQNFIDCSYTSLSQCAMSASGRAAECVVNPYFASAQLAPAPHHRHRRVH